MCIVTARNLFGDPVAIRERRLEVARAGAKTSSSQAYYILSRERSNGTAHWWRPNRSGYTSDLNEAGLYGEAEAQAIQRDSHGGDVAYRSDLVSTLLVVRRTVDMTEKGNAAFFADAVDVPG